jgi:hypothetical protein
MSSEHCSCAYSPPPMQTPWTAAMTGLLQFSIDVKLSCIASTIGKNFKATLAWSPARRVILCFDCEQRMLRDIYKKR